MTVASSTETSEDLVSCPSGVDSDQLSEDEIESDVDYKEMRREYACDAYLSRWLPSIKDMRIPEDPANNLPSHNRQYNTQEQIQAQTGRGAISVQSGNHLKSAVVNRPHQEAETNNSRDYKTGHENGKKTYFEAIKCSPIKLRQTIAINKQTNVNEALMVKPQPSNSTEENTTPPSPVEHCLVEVKKDALNETGNPASSVTRQNSELKSAKTHVSPCVVEVTKDGLGQLGSLRFQAKKANRRPSEAVCSTCHMVGGKIRKVHRNFNNRLPCGKNNDDLLVHCESVMIYPKALVGQRNEKSPVKTVEPREAWRENCFLSFGRKAEDSARLPDLGNKDSVTLQEKCVRRLPQGLGQNSKNTQAGSFHNLHTSASTKIIIPFGEYEKNTVEEDETFEKSLSQANENEQTEVKTTCVAYKEQTSTKSRGKYRQNQKGLRQNFLDNYKKKTPGIVIGVTRLDIPRKITIETKHPWRISPPSSPLKRLKMRNSESKELFLGREDDFRDRATPGSSHGQRKRTDFCRISKESSPITSSKECESCKFVLNAESDVSLKIGGTALFKEQRNLQEDLRLGRRALGLDKRTVHFSAV